MTSKNLRTRVDRIGKKLSGHAPRPRNDQDEPDMLWPDEKWLVHFERLGQQGRFDNEPDFAKALDAYATAICKAKSLNDPPWRPPSSFEPYFKDQPLLRLDRWRNHIRFPEVYQARLRLLTMEVRISRGLPPDTDDTTLLRVIVGRTREV